MSPQAPSRCAHSWRNCAEVPPAPRPTFGGRGLGAQALRPSAEGRGIAENRTWSGNPAARQCRRNTDFSATDNYCRPVPGVTWLAFRHQPRCSLHNLFPMTPLSQEWSLRETRRDSDMTSRSLTDFYYRSDLSTASTTSRARTRELHFDFFARKKCREENAVPFGTRTSSTNVE